MISDTETDHSPVTAAQMRAARSLLNWSREETARLCGVGVNTLGRFENGGRIPAPRILEEFARVFEEQGVIFVTDERGRGVFLLEPPSKPLSDIS